MMATAAKLDVAPNATKDIAVIVAQTPAVVLIDAGKRDDLYAHIRREVEAFTPDLTTAKGREAIKSLAYKITRTKTAIDAAGKQLNEEARAKIGVVDAARRDARETLEAMANEVRRPLTEWEEAEKARLAECSEIINRIALAGTITLNDTADTVRARGAEIWTIEITADRFGDMFEQATKAKAHTVDLLKTGLARLTQEEADRAELEKLRAEALERERMAAEKAAAEEAARQKAEAERLAEERRAAAAKAEAERIAAAEKAAEDRARQAAERAAQEDRDRVQREHEAAVAEANARAEEADRARRAEAGRIAKEKADAEAAAKRVADEQAKRDADQKHRTAVKSAAKAAIMSCGADDDTARKIVMAIIAGEVPHVSLKF